MSSESEMRMEKISYISNGHVQEGRAFLEYFPFEEGPHLYLPVVRHDHLSLEDLLCYGILKVTVALITYSLELAPMSLPLNWSGSGP